MKDTASDQIVRRIRALRKARDWTAAKLAERCAEAGAPHITAAVIANIETGRRKNGRRTRPLTIDELLDIARALSVAPADLIESAVATREKQPR